MIAEKEIKATGKPAIHRPIRCPQKTGINMNMREKRTGTVLTLVIGCACIAVLALVVAKFGVIDLYQGLSDAQSEYARTHEQNAAVQEKLSHFDEVLTEYRTYSMDWIASGEESELDVTVERTQVLDLLETAMLPFSSSLNRIEVQGDTVDVELNGTNLDRVADSLLTIGRSPLVASVELEEAKTEDQQPADVVGCTIHIVLQGEVAE